MDPASPAELDEIVAELLADAGPPLYVQFSDGRIEPAGTRQVTHQSLERTRDRMAHVRKLREQLEAIMRERGWEQDETTLVWKVQRTTRAVMRDIDP